MNHVALSVIIPAFNEEHFLSATLQAIRRSAATMEPERGATVELIVVDNNSTDATASVARSFGASVVFESARNIARARNQGALAATGQVLVFIDADTLIPEGLLPRIYEIASTSECVGGAIDTEYRVQKTVVRGYLNAWRIAGRLAHIAQGATQFCTRDTFAALGGYDERLFMGEDVNFYSRLRQYARRRKSHACFIHDLPVVPSTRRFDQWPLWRTLLLTNPFVIAGFRRVQCVWQGWYREPPR